MAGLTSPLSFQFSSSRFQVFQHSFCAVTSVIGDLDGGAYFTVFIGGPIVGKKLYVGNLAYSVTDSVLESLFEEHGTVQSVQVIMDRDTGRSKGFGFVEMNSDAEAQAAISALNGQEVEERALTVNEAKPREDRGGSRGGGGGGRGYGGGGRGGYGGGGRY